MLLNIYPQSVVDGLYGRQVGLHQVKTFCRAKETINRMERQSMEQEKQVENHISDESISEIYKGTPVANVPLLVDDLSSPLHSFWLLGHIGSSLQHFVCNT